MASKNSRTLAAKTKPLIAPDVTLIQVLGGGEYMRVFIASTGKNVHGKTTSDAIAAALTENVNEGYGERMLAEVAKRPENVRGVVAAAVNGH